MRTRLAVLAFGMALAAPVLASEDTAGWLGKISSAARSANYQGVLVYRGDDTLETFRLTHRFEAGAERERVQSLTGEVRELIRHNDKVTCLLPKEQPLSAGRAMPKGLLPTLSPERLARIADYYELKELGEQRVAGRKCRGIAVAPRDEFRYGYEIWADAETAVPLKVSMITADKGLLEQMFFTEISFPSSIPDTAFVSELDADQRQNASEQAVEALVEAHHEAPVSKPPTFTLSTLPPGFNVVRRSLRAAADGSVLEHVVLSDGLSAVSVFRASQPAERPAQAQRLDQMGAVNAYSRVVGRMRVTVVGEAPRRTVKMIGDSFDARPEPVQASTPGP